MWDSPIVGAGGTTVGEALSEMTATSSRQLDRLGQRLVDAHGLLAVPIVGDWLTRKDRRALRRGFVEPLAAQPKQVICSVVQASPSGSARTPTGAEDPASSRDGRRRRRFAVAGLA